MGALDLPLFGVDGRPLIVDGFLGHLFVNPSTHLTNHYQDLMEEEREFSEELKELKDSPCVTRDGRRVQLWVNIGLIGRHHPARWTAARKVSACSAPKCRS